MDSKKWLEQKKDREFRETLPALAEGDEITKNLKRFASQRPDLYEGQEQSAENMAEEGAEQQK